MNTSSTPPKATKAYDPVVVAFVCTYCSYTAADLAGSLRLSYPTNVRIIKMTCTGKTDPLVVLRAFEKGADAVFVAGCRLGDCHFVKGNIRGKSWVNFTKKRLAEIGLHPERLEYFHVAASDAAGWVDAVTDMTNRAFKLGPSPFNPKYENDSRSDALLRPKTSDKETRT